MLWHTDAYGEMQDARIGGMGRHAATLVEESAGHWLRPCFSSSEESKMK